MLVGTIGHPQHDAFPSLFDGIAREHSRKPDEFYAMVRRKTEGLSRRDLFSRETREGFAGWGDEHGKFDQGQPRQAGESHPPAKECQPEPAANHQSR